MSNLNKQYKKFKKSRSMVKKCKRGNIHVHVYGKLKCKVKKKYYNNNISLIKLRQITILLGGIKC